MTYFIIWDAGSISTDRVPEEVAAIPKIFARQITIINGNAHGLMSSKVVQNVTIIKRESEKDKTGAETRMPCFTPVYL